MNNISGNNNMIVTHNGRFHADEVVACAMLKTIFPTYSIHRTRNINDITKDDIAFNVG